MIFNKNASRETATLGELFLPLPMQKITAKRIEFASVAAEIHRGFLWAYLPTRPVRFAFPVLAPARKLSFCYWTSAPASPLPLPFFITHVLTSFLAPSLSHTLADLSLYLRF